MWQCQPRYGGHEKSGNVSLRRGGRQCGGIRWNTREISGGKGLKWGDRLGCQGDRHVGSGDTVALTAG